MSDVDPTVADDEGDEVEADDAPATPAAAVAVLEYLVKHVVDDPESVHIDVDDQGRRPTLNVHVGPGDMGRVIGKRGRVAQSIRTVVRAAAARDGAEVDIEFID